MAKRRVVLTGASGYIAQRMFAELTERWDVVPIDVRATTRGGKSVPGMLIADLTKPNRDEYRHLFRGADAVIHCAFVSAAGLDANTWQANSDAKFWAEYQNVAHRFWSIANAREKIGYAPEDDSQANFADKIAAIARAAKS